MFPPIYPLVAAYAPAVALLKTGNGPIRFYQFGFNSTQPQVYPYAVWRRVFGNPLNYINSPPDTDTFSIQVDAYESASNPYGADKVRQIIAAIRDSIEIPQAAQIQSWLPEDRDPDTKNWHWGFQVDFFVAR